ncbi:CAP domain-containing protein [Bacillus testis]|uniref:CAP domain-containing protein n=1 Tax=Bacillus testis TaxID=1622072 RepID=UPI000B069417|nr:CAP domain-containing protein [Bacillus testis]
MFIGSLYFDNNDKDPALNDERSANQVQNTTGLNKNMNEVGRKPSSGLALYVGGSSAAIIDTFGQPARKDPSSYGYDWWIYNASPEGYMQVGVKNNKVVTIYALGKRANVSPITIGQKVDELFRSFNLETTIDLEWEGNSYRFELSEEDLGMRPLVKVGDVYAQVYIDKFTGKISSVRFLDVETLVKQRPYELIYRGNLPKDEELSEEDWKKIQAGDEQQIFDITNVIRERFGLHPVKWDEATSKVAYLHSLDMYKEDYFSHDSPVYGDLAKRLQTGNVKYRLAGENIAAKYVDGVAAFEGWLNSKGHREALLNKEFTYLGVGVHQKYYTQNFIEK